MNMRRRSARSELANCRFPAISTSMDHISEGRQGGMASVAFHLNTQLNNGEAKLFEDGETGDCFTWAMAAVNL